MRDPLLVPSIRTRKVVRGLLFGFTFRDPSVTCIGRVVRDDARFPGAPNVRFVVYVYRPIGAVDADAGSLSAALTIDRLLLPPKFTNLAGWSGGWFWPIGTAALTPDLELPQHSFRSATGKSVDEYGNPVLHPTDPAGPLAFSGYNGIALQAFSALGLRTSDGKTASHLFADEEYH